MVKRNKNNIKSIKIGKGLPHRIPSFLFSSFPRLPTHKILTRDFTKDFGVKKYIQGEGVGMLFIGMES